MTVNDGDTEPGQQRRIALVAHDGRKQDMREFLISSPLMSSYAVGHRPATCA